MLKFSAKDLKPVLLEARKNHCGVVLVKDHGVYIMSETGELTPRGRKVAYAKKCDELSTTVLILLDDQLCVCF